MPNRDHYLTIRLSKEEYERLKVKALEQSRALSQMARVLIVDGMKKR